MPKPQSERGASVPRVVKEQPMPAYRYQDQRGGSGSLSSKSNERRADEQDVLRSINFS